MLAKFSQAFFWMTLYYNGNIDNLHERVAIATSFMYGWRAVEGALVVQSGQIPEWNGDVGCWKMQSLLLSLCLRPHVV